MVTCINDALFKLSLKRKFLEKRINIDETSESRTGLFKKKMFLKTERRHCYISPCSHNELTSAQVQGQLGEILYSRVKEL